MEQLTHYMLRDSRSFLLTVSRDAKHKMQTLSKCGIFEKKLDLILRVHLVDNSRQVAYGSIRTMISFPFRNHF